MRDQKFPPGWSTERVAKLLGHYESQSEDEAVAEDEAAFEHADSAFLEVPRKLVPAVRRILSEHKT